MSLDVSTSVSDFTTLENPDFDLASVGVRTFATRRTNTSPSLLSIPLREMLVIQPPLAKSERLPMTLVLEPGELALSRDPHPGRIKVSKLGLYIPRKHLSVLDLVYAEMADPDYNLTHGTGACHRRGCSGPLCRRAKREASAEARELKQVRERQRPQLQTRAGRYAQLKVSAPQYGAIEPLLFSFTVYCYQMNRPTRVFGESEIYRALDTPLKLYKYLHTTFAPDVSTEVDAKIE